ncbi:MAG: response regulator [Chloroflexota bacterium]|nr:response regulator [Anaerolineales bacterium]
MKLEEFRKLVKDVLEHLYDTAYLEVHPLLPQVSGVTTTNRSTRAQALRSILKDAVEELRPPEGIPSGSPEWRSYLVLRCRYIQGMTMGQVENELGLSKRQLQREIRKGLEALASILWTNSRVNPDAQPADEFALMIPPPELDQELDPLETELDQWQLTLQNCDVRSLLNDTLWLLRSTVEQSQTDIQVDLAAVLPPVFVDATLTRQALFKIMRLMIQNSQGALSLTATPDRNFIMIQMHNSDCAHCLDESAWQAAQRIIRDQGGSLDVENNPALGFQITIRLPLAGQTRVLVIDDNQGMLQLFERYLTPHHYEVKKAQGGSEALSLVTENRPDLIILDVMMPSMDGWQVLRSLKQNPITERTPIIICSVLKEPELAMSLGARAYLKKPVDRLELLATVERILHQ